MKKITILITAIGLLSLISCKKDETKTLLSTPTVSVLSAVGTSPVVFQKSDSATVITYNWTAAKFGPTVVITYTLEMAKDSTNFANPVSLGTTTNLLTLSVLLWDLNMKLQPLEFDAKHPVPIHLDYRVKAVINNNVDPVYSPVVQQTITPFYVPVVYPLLFVPGSYQGWNAGDSSTTIASVTSSDKYEGYIWFPTDAVAFKYDQGGSWTINWGDNGATGTLVPGGANIIAGPRGYYKLNVDLGTLTHTFLRTAWSLIGDATPGGWNTDTDMAYDTIAKVWTVTVDLTANNIKFRANHDWVVNYGDNAPADGVLDFGGANIPVTAPGNYTVTLDLSHPVYKYQLVKH